MRDIEGRLRKRVRALDCYDPPQGTLYSEAADVIAYLRLLLRKKDEEIAALKALLEKGTPIEEQCCFSSNSIPCTTKRMPGTVWCERHQGI